MIGAFIIGFVGSLHCIGMCGPLSLLMMGGKRPLLGFTLYHSGRIATYILLGVFLGLIGYSINLFQIQLVTTFALGALLIILYGVPAVRVRLERFYYSSIFYKKIQRWLTSNLSMKKRWLMSGVANGFLPCGLTYVAAAGAVAMGDLFQSMQFMLLFGLGTVPALAVVSIGSVKGKKVLKKLIPQSVPVIAILSGILLLTRGLLIASPDFNEMVQANAAGLITVCGLGQ